MVIVPPRAWLREMLSLVRWEAFSVEGADLEQLMKNHSEYHLQIDRQLSKSKGVKEEGRRLIREGNAMSAEVRTEARLSKTDQPSTSDLSSHGFYHQILSSSCTQ